MTTAAPKCIRREPDTKPQDLHALIAMLDYVLIETTKIDHISAYCLAMARLSLLEIQGRNVH
jgi:hypothetical protein